MKKILTAFSLFIMLGGALLAPSAHIPQTIVYQNPSGLTLQQIGERFHSSIMSRGKFEEFLPGYLSVGVANNYIYLIADNTWGAFGLSTVESQTTLCNESQKTAPPLTTNNVTMDTGDFCKIHDAIVLHTCLIQYPDLCPTENWFMHKADGTRYMDSIGMYRVNHGNPDWQKFFARRALREVAFTDPNHPPLVGITGIYLDNLNGSFNQLIALGGNKPPKEFATNELYDAAMVELSKVVDETLGSHLLIGNLNDLSTDWTPFTPYLDGGLSESWATYWGSPASVYYMQNSMTEAEKWTAQSKTLYLVTQGNTSGGYNKFGLSMYLLVMQDGVEYRYSNYSSYAGYYDIPEYLYDMGQPLELRRKISDSPLVYERCFENGKVQSNLTTFIGTILLNPCTIIIPTFTPTIGIPTNTKTPTSTLTPIVITTPISPTFTITPSITITPTQNIIVPTPCRLKPRKRCPTPVP